MSVRLLLFQNDKMDPSIFYFFLMFSTLRCVLMAFLQLQPVTISLHRTFHGLILCANAIGTVLAIQKNKTCLFIWFLVNSATHSLRRRKSESLMCCCKQCETFRRIIPLGFCVCCYKTDVSKFFFFLSFFLTENPLLHV